MLFPTSSSTSSTKTTTTNIDVVERLKFWPLLYSSSTTSSS